MLFNLPTEIICKIIEANSSFDDAYLLSCKINYVHLTLESLIKKHSITLDYLSEKGYIDVLIYLAKNCNIKSFYYSEDA
jgi:hypothetical protein